MTWLPKSVVCLSYYDLFRFRSDVVAALILALQIFPVSIAIATTAGLPAAYGISCAVIAGFLASAFGDSKIGVSAPNIVFVVVASSIVGRDGIVGLSLSTLLAGVLLIFFGAARFGAAIQMVPRAVVMGFSTGIAVLVVSQQLSKLFRVSSQIAANEVRTGAMMVAQRIVQMDTRAITVAIAALILMMACRRVFKHVPGSFIAIVAGSLLVKVQHLPVRTIDASLGSNLISFQFHATGVLSPGLFSGVLAHAFAIAILVAIESLEAMKLATRLTSEHFNPNGELFVHGGVNIGSALLGGLPASGVSSYTSENPEAGAQTPMAGILRGVFLGVFLLLIAPFVRFIPLPVVSAIILSSVLTMANWREIPQLIKLSRAEAAACVRNLFSDHCHGPTHSDRRGDAHRDASVHPQAKTVSLTRLSAVLCSSFLYRMLQSLDPTLGSIPANNTRKRAWQ